MYINKYNLLAKEIVEENASNFALEHIKITKESTIATDGKILVIIKNPKVNDEEFPKNNLKNCEDSIHLSLNEIKKIEKILPKKTSVPVLKNAKIGIDEDKKIKILTTDLENDIEIQHKEPDIKYPDIKTVYPLRKEEKGKVTLSVELLEKLLKVVKKLSDKGCVGIDFTFYENNGPVKFEFKNSNTSSCEGLILPIKKENE